VRIVHIARHVIDAAKRFGIDLARNPRTATSVTRGLTFMIECPVCDDAGPWPDTYGAAGGRRKRFIHVYEHDVRGLPFKKIERL